MVEVWVYNRGKISNAAERYRLDGGYIDNIVTIDEGGSTLLMRQNKVRYEKKGPGAQASSRLW